MMKKTVFVFVILLLIILSQPINVWAENVKVPVLMYHNITKTLPQPYDPLNVTPKDFEDQLRTLKEYGFQTITFKDYLEFVKGSKKLNPNVIILTFDDGYSSVYDYAYPMLKKYNMKATVFLIGSSIDSPNHLTWKQLEEMKETGVFSFQNHTYTHRILTRLPDKQIREEILKCKKLIERKLGEKVDTLAYPIGIYNSRVEKIAEKLGTKIMVTTKYGVNSKNTPLSQIQRIRVCGNVGGKELLSIISRATKRKYVKQPKKANTYSKVSIPLYYKNASYVFTQNPVYMKDGSALFPLKRLLNIIGGNVYWNSNQLYAVIYRGSSKLIIDFKYKNIVSDDEKIKIDIFPVLKEGKLYIPIRLLEKAFGMKVIWDSTNQAVVVKD